MKTDLNPIFDAFRLHDEQGLPLTVSVAAAKAKGSRINLAAFACDALHAGWTMEKIDGTLKEVCADNGESYDPVEFRKGLSALWSACPTKGDPEVWREMKAFIVDTPNRMAKA